MDRIMFIMMSFCFCAVIATAEVWTLKLEGNTTKYNIKKINQIRVSKKCKDEKCKALGVLNKKYFIAPLGTSSSGTAIPGSGATCKYLGGNIYILTNEKNIQEQFCKFDDESIMSITDYYRL